MLFSWFYCYLAGYVAPDGDPEDAVCSLITVDFPFLLWASETGAQASETYSDHRSLHLAEHKRFPGPGHKLSCL